MPAIPYIPESPEETIATSLPDMASSMAILQRSTSLIIPVALYSLSGKMGFRSLMYVVYPVTTSASWITFAARNVMCSCPPGPKPTTCSLPLAIAIAPSPCGTPW